MTHTRTEYLTQRELLQRAHELRSEAMVNGLSAVAQIIARAFRNIGFRATGHAQA